MNFVDSHPDMRRLRSFFGTNRIHPVPTGHIAAVQIAAAFCMSSWLFFTFAQECSQTSQKHGFNIQMITVDCITHKMSVPVLQHFSWQSAAGVSHTISMPFSCLEAGWSTIETL